MTDTEMLESIVKHESALTEIAKNMSTMNGQYEKLNSKIDNLMESINEQRMLLEKINSVESRTKDSFTRVDSRIAELYQIQKVGCTPLQLSNQTLATLDGRLVKIEETNRWIVRSILGAIIAGVLTLLYQGTKGG